MKERYIRTYGNAYELPSPRNRELMSLFHHTCRKHGILHDNNRIFAEMARWEEKTAQLSFF